jgi:hypothetical protein
VDDNGQPSRSEGQLARGGGRPGLMLRQMRVGDPRSVPRRTVHSASRLMPGENQRLTVAHPEYERATLGGVALAGGAVKSGVSIVMRRGATIVGLVKDGNGDPVAGAEVELAQSANFQAGRGGMMASLNILGGPGQRPREKTGADGRFQFKGVAAGGYAVVARKPGFATERHDTVRVPEEGSPEADTVTLAPGAIIAGRVVRMSGGGAEGFMVSASSPGRKSRFAGWKPDDRAADRERRRVSPRGLKAGETYDLQALSDLGRAPESAAVAGTSDVRSAPGAPHRGRRDGCRDGPPAHGLPVSYEPIAAAAAWAWCSASVAVRDAPRRRWRTPCREVGRRLLRSRGRQRGTWSVVVEAKGYQSARAGGVVVEDGATKSGEVKASPGVVLKGHVTDATSAWSVDCGHAAGRAGPMMMLG